MFMFQYITELIQFNSNSVSMTDEGGIQLLLEFHPKFAMQCWKNNWKFTDFYNTKFLQVHMPYKRTTEHKNSLFLLLVSQIHICISPTRFFVLKLWTAFF
jgi:hypothetical protein